MSSSKRSTLNLPSDEELQTASENPDTYKDYTKKKSKHSSKKKLRVIATTKAELQYRQKHPVSDNDVEQEKLVCTSCGKNLKLLLIKHSSIFSHPVLGVLLCKSCADFYGEGEFSVDEDGTDKYCRWCGQGGKLYLCSTCNFGFCTACIKRNFPRSYLKEVLDDNWKCLACESNPLWNLRSLCVATLNYTKEKKPSRKPENKAKSSRSPRTVKITSSESEEEQGKRKADSRKKKKSRDSSSETSERRKRKRNISSSDNDKQKKKKKKKRKNSSDEPHEKDDQGKTPYNKSIDRETIIDTKAAEKLISKCTVQVEDLLKVLRAVSTEVKKMTKEDMVAKNILDYPGRKKVLKKMFMLQDMSCQSITQVCENFVLAYQSVIVNFINDSTKKGAVSDSDPEETEKKKKTESDNAVAISESDESKKTKGKKSKSDNAVAVSESEESVKTKKEKSKSGNAVATTESEPDESEKTETKKGAVATSDSESDEAVKTKKKKTKSDSALMSESESEESEMTKEKTKSDNTVAMLESESHESVKTKNKKSKSDNAVAVSDSESNESGKTKKKKRKSDSVVAMSESDPDESGKAEKKEGKSDSAVAMSESDPDESEKTKDKKKTTDSDVESFENRKRETSDINTLSESGSDEEQLEYDNPKINSRKGTLDESTHKRKRKDSNSDNSQVHDTSEGVKSESNLKSKKKAQKKCNELDDNSDGEQECKNSCDDQEHCKNETETSCRPTEDQSDNAEGYLSGSETVMLSPSQGNVSEHIKQKEHCSSNSCDELVNNGACKENEKNLSANAEEQKAVINLSEEIQEGENGKSSQVSDSKCADDEEHFKGSDDDCEESSHTSDIHRKKDNKQNVQESDSNNSIEHEQSFQKGKKNASEKYPVSTSKTDVISHKKIDLSDSDDEIRNSKSKKRELDLKHDGKNAAVSCSDHDEDVISDSGSEKNNAKKHAKLGIRTQQNCSIKTTNLSSSKDALCGSDQENLADSDGENCNRETLASNKDVKDSDNLAESDGEIHTKDKTESSRENASNDRDVSDMDAETNEEKMAFSDKASSDDDRGALDSDAETPKKEVEPSNEDVLKGSDKDIVISSDEETQSNQKAQHKNVFSDSDKLDSDEEICTNNKPGKSNSRNLDEETKTHVAKTVHSASENRVSNDSDGSKSEKKDSLLSGIKLDKNKKDSVETGSRSDKELYNDENKKALMSLLASSSSEDDSIRLRKSKRNKCTSEKCGPLSSKSMSYQIAHKNELSSSKFSDVSDEMDSDEEKPESGRSYEDFAKDFNIQKCTVVLNKLDEDVYEHYCDNSHSSKSSRVQMSEKEEIEKLVDLRSLDVTTKKKTPSVDSSSESGEEGNLHRKKVFRKHVKKQEKKKEKETLKDFHNNDDGLSSQSNHSDESDKESKNEEGLKNILEKLNKTRDKLAEELLLRSSSSDSDDDIFSKEKKEKKRKELKAKVKTEEEKEEKKEKEEKEEKEENDNGTKKDDNIKKEESDDSDEEIRKKKRWRSDKLLSMKLSETDTSEDERKWEARKEKDAKQENKERKKPTSRRRLIDSDSDIQLISSDSPDEESSGDDFKPFTKRKRKGNSDSSKSDKKDSDSDSDKSVKKKTKRRRIRKPVSDSSGSDNADIDNSQKSDNTPSKGRKNIRKVMKDDNVAEATRRAAKEEEERRQRIAEKQKLYNALYNLAEAQVETVDQLVLDFDSESKTELVEVDKNLVKKLKPHQVKGVKFMWDACFESIEMIKKSDGSGCILAHCMGLGKTLQVITLAHTVLNNPETKMKTILVVCPLSTVLNWVTEFSKWLDYAEDNDIEILELTKYKQMYERIGALKHWYQRGGVLIIGYQMYRILTNPKQKTKKRCVETLQHTLVEPGPDLVICDEGHLLKNEESALSKAMSRLKTKRRIVLTGTPLQNNLLEYHCMVQFVKPNLLGTKKEFKNRFINPINNGQFENSTAHDVKVMKRRAHVLHKMLDSSVQRYDYSVLTPFLPPKFEYVLLIRLTERQIKLYKYYLEFFAAVSTDGNKTKTARLFSDFQALQRIWTHPRVLLMNEKRQEKKDLLEDNSDSEGSLRDFVVSTTSESSSSDSDIKSVNSDSKNEKKKERHKPRTRSNKNNAQSDDDSSVKSVEKKDVDGETNGNENDCSHDWWRQFIDEESQLDDIRESGKLDMLFTILEECEKIGDKVLVFSQSLFSLDLIEYFLEKMDEATQNKEGDEKLEGHNTSWALGLDYFRLDGSSSAENRQTWCKTFNREDNDRARLFLISTRAGGLGINLIAANRVVLFDASWNPSHDVQSIFRVYRFGQKKPCYIYRFLAEHTMEEKIYNRQVTKLSLACRVVDEQQIERHYSMDDLQELYIFNPEEKKNRETPLVPKDVLLAELVRGEDSWVNTYHEHDTLLENKEEEELNEEERKAAWEDYEKEKQGLRPSVAMYDNSAIMTYLSQFGYTENQIRDSIMRENPQWSEAQIQFHVSRVLRQLLDYVSAQEYRKQIQAQYSNAQQQPMYHQTPQTQGLMQMQPQMQINPQIQSQQQRQMPVVAQNNILASSAQNMLTGPSGNSVDNINPQPGTSIGADAQSRIKVKSFGLMHNSNFGSPQVITNPFAGRQSNPPAQNVKHQQVKVLSRRSVLNQKAVKKNTPGSVVNDVIEVE